MKVDFLVVGAGISGSTVAERIASQLDKKVLLVERRDHIGGNAYDYLNEEGIMVQKYGAHIFHTNSKDIWNYMSSFTEWNDYVHRVLARVNDKEVYLPVNIETMERLYDRTFTPEEMTEFLEDKRVKVDVIRNSRDAVVSQVGEELYELLFKNYTKKHWGVYPEELLPEVTGRLPVRMNRDTRYFTDKYQGMPKHGYTPMFERMLSHKKITVLLDTDYKNIVDDIEFDKIVFTGPIDYFFDYKHGKLPYRSLEFRTETLDVEKFQNAAVVNYPNEHEYTRIIEFKYFYFQENKKTTICYEYPRASGDPFYPIPKDDCQDLYRKYKYEADKLKSIHFVGRLAQYRYINMDQAVGAAITLVKKLS